MTEPMEPLLTLDDLAEYLQIPKRTIYAWRYRREGPTAIRVGGHLRYRQSDVVDWLNEQRQCDDRKPAKDDQ
jgi:excisionase family DNA binding protein